MRWEERDYVLRLIQDFGRFLRALRDETGELARQMLLDGRCRTVCGMGLKAVDHLDEASLTALLPEEARLSLSLLLAARAEVTARGEEERARWQGKALRLMLASREDGAVCQALSDTADGLMRAAMDGLTAEELYACAGFFRSGGRMDLMDNAVFFLWETLPDRMAWRDRLTALYDGLDGDALVGCGLTAADIGESLSRLKDV